MAFIHPSQGTALAKVLESHNIDHVISTKSGVLFVDGPDYAAIINEAGIIECIERLREVPEVELPLRALASMSVQEMMINFREPTESITDIDPPDSRADVPFREMMDITSSEVVGLCFGDHPMPSIAWRYADAIDHVSRDVFNRAIWPIVGDMERANYADGYCATVFR